MNKNSILGIIPARGGSKGIPRKNIQLVAGRPLIEYTIRAAQNSKLITEFITSTEDQEISRIAESFGSPVLHRPIELAKDDTKTADVAFHVLKCLKRKHDYVVVLQPTSPFRRSEDIDNALSLLIDSNAETVLSVCKVVGEHPSRMYSLANDKLIPYDSRFKEMPRQLVPILYKVNGAIYACRASIILEKKTLIGSDIRPYIMPRERSLSIDDELDLMFAEFLIQKSDFSN